MEEADGEKTQKELDEEIKRKKERQVHCMNQEKEGTTGTLYTVKNKSNDRYTVKNKRYTLQIL